MTTITPVTKFLFSFALQYNSAQTELEFIKATQAKQAFLNECFGISALYRIDDNTIDCVVDIFQAQFVIDFFNSIK